MATMLANPEAATFRAEAFEAYRVALLKLEAEGVAVADVTAIHNGLLTRKK